MWRGKNGAEIPRPRLNPRQRGWHDRRQWRVRWATVQMARNRARDESCDWSQTPQMKWHLLKQLISSNGSDDEGWTKRWNEACARIEAAAWSGTRARRVQKAEPAVSSVRSSRLQCLDGIKFDDDGGFKRTAANSGSKCVTMHAAAAATDNSTQQHTSVLWNWNATMPGGPVRHR